MLSCTGISEVEERGKSVTVFTSFPNEMKGHVRAGEAAMLWSESSLLYLTDRSYVWSLLVFVLVGIIVGYVLINPKKRRRGLRRVEQQEEDSAAVALHMPHVYLQPTDSMLHSWLKSCCTEQHQRNHNRVMRERQLAL